jgi:hypothetical protein
LRRQNFGRVRSLPERDLPDDGRCLVVWVATQRGFGKSYGRLMHSGLLGLLRESGEFRSLGSNDSTCESEAFAASQWQEHASSGGCVAGEFREIGIGVEGWG